MPMIAAQLPLPWSDVYRLVRAVVARRYLSHVRRTVESVEDVTQDAMLSVWRASPHADGAHLPHEVIGTIAQRQVFDTLRKWTTRRQSSYRPEALSFELDRGGGTIGGSLLAPDDADRERLMDAGAALMAADPRDRTVLLAWACGWENGEIARALAISVPRINQLKHRARAAVGV